MFGASTSMEAKLQDTTEEPDDLVALSPEGSVCFRYAYPASICQSVVAWASATVVTATPICNPAIMLVCVLATFRLLGDRLVMLPAAILVLFMVLMFTPHKKWPAFGRWQCRMFSSWCSLFEANVVYEAPCDPDLKDFVLAMHPHGVQPLMANMVWGITADHGYLPDYIVAASAALRIPGLRQMCMWQGAIAAGRKPMEAALEKKGSSAGVFPGGIAEMVSTSKAKDVLVEPRTSFLELAKTHGKAIIPVLSFGISECYSRWPSAEATWAQQFSIKHQVALVIPIGRLGLPIPKYSKITVIIGRPIDVMDKSVEEIRKLYVQWFKDAHEKYKHQAGYSDRELVFNCP